VKQLKMTSIFLASLAAVLVVLGQCVSQMAAQQVPLHAADGLPVFKDHATVAGALVGCFPAQQETTKQQETPNATPCTEETTNGLELQCAPSPYPRPFPHCPPNPLPHFMQYRAFIPADHLVTAVPCYLEQEQASLIPSINSVPFNVPLGLIMVLGDASSFSTHYRIKEHANLSFSGTGPGLETPVVAVPSVSYNFQYPSSPISGNIGSGDFNPQALLICKHEQNTGSSSLANVGGTTSSTGANQASMTFCCSGTDPLFANPVEPIQCNLTVSINTATNQATTTGTRTCFPSHEIVIGTQVVYPKNPVGVNFGVLLTCLLTYPVVETTVNCTVTLDGVSKCP
jgi:hypothetical protein